MRDVKVDGLPMQQQRCPAHDCFRCGRSTSSGEYQLAITADFGGASSRRAGLFRKTTVDAVGRSHVRLPRHWTVALDPLRPVNSEYRAIASQRDLLVVQKAEMLR